MNRQIHFTKTTSFLGRNGCFKATGLTIFKLGDMVQIYPVTSKDKLGKCNICIPQGSIPELIDTLRLFLEGGSDTAPDSKGEKIKYIKDVLATWGRTTCAELNRDHSPCKASIGEGKQNVSELIEEFDAQGVSAVTYNDEIEIGYNDYNYEDLEDYLIDEIVEIMEEYEADMLKTEKRCKD